MNFTDLDVYVVDDEILSIEIEKEVPFWGRQKVQYSVTMLEKSMRETPDIKDSVMEDLNSSEELMAISVTEAPVVFVDNHYERISETSVLNVADYEASEKSEESTKWKFSLYTKIQKSSTKNSDGTYEYIARTKGSWSANSFWGGENYPASGTDYVLQSAPNDWVRTSHYMNAYYDNDVDGEEGKEYWFSDGGANFLQGHLVDDPWGWRQNESFSMVCRYAANASNSYRIINSWYVHTWSEISIDVSVSVSSKKEVVLDIDPSSTEKSWTLYNYVSFNF